MSLDRPWLQSYPKGVPAEIDVNEFHSVASVFDASVAKFRDRPAYSSFGKVLTYGETDALVEQFAAYLLGELKLKKGDRVAPLMPNCLQYPVATFGVLRAGLTVVNVNPLYTARELKHQLVDAGVTALVVVDNFGDTVEQVIADLKAGPLAHLSLRVLQRQRRLAGLRSDRVQPDPRRRRPGLGPARPGPTRHDP